MFGLFQLLSKSGRIMLSRKFKEARDVIPLWVVLTDEMVSGGHAVLLRESISFCLRSVGDNGVRCGAAAKT